MFENPSEGFQAVDPGRYIVRVVGLDPTEHVEYGPGIKWRFNLAEQATGTPIYQADGSMYELWQTTSTKLSPRSRARPWVEALLGRDLADGDTGPALAQEVIGKKALALVGPNDKGYTSILSMSPYKAALAKKGGAESLLTEEEKDQAVAF